MKLKSVLLVLLFISVHVFAQSDSVHADSSEFNSSKLYWKKYSPLIVPAVLIGTGIFIETQDDQLWNSGVQEENQEWLKGFHTNADDYLQYAPVAAGYILHIAGLKSKDPIGDASWKLAKAEILMMAMVTTSKYFTAEKRPDAGTLNSFPSGHTSQAFLAASFLHAEFGHHSPLISIAGYSTAVAVGTMRVLNNRHWLGDVVAGAGCGILSWQIIELTHKGTLFGKKDNLSIFPNTNGKDIFSISMIWQISN